MKSLKITSSSGGWDGTVNRLNNRIMNSPTTTQNNKFLTREFIKKRSFSLSTLPGKPKPFQSIRNTTMRIEHLQPTALYVSPHRYHRNPGIPQAFLPAVRILTTAT